MAGPAIFEHEIAFEPSRAADVLRALPAAAGVVALMGPQATDKPHMLKAANIRRRLQGLLEPAEGQTKRLNLRDRIARIAWRETGSEFESLLVLHRAMLVVFGAEETRRRMRLSTPYTVRFAAETRYPRIYATNHLRRRSLATTFGPFASKFAAERYCEAVEELFQIRRCFQELRPSPDDPGCIYGEIRKCMAPCQARCTDEQYGAEAAEVLEFLRTRGASRVSAIEAERDDASAAMMFEAAAEAHVRATKAKSVASMADELVQPIDALRAVMVMPCHSVGDEPHVAVFAYADGCLRGPERVSMLGVRLAREQADVGTSLFAQPMMLAAVPLEGSVPDAPEKKDAEASGTAGSSGSAEERMMAAVMRLQDGSAAPDTQVLSDHLALLRRWYYRPEKQRVGTIFFRERDSWPVRRMVRAAAKLLLPVGDEETTFHAQAQKTRTRKKPAPVVEVPAV